MEDELQTGAEGTERPEPVDPTGIPSLPAELTEKEQEVRRLVDAGASSPEELRALAAKLQEQRTYEEELWRREVRPALMQSKKRRAKVVSPSEGRRDDHDTLRLAALLVGATAGLLVIAMLTSVVWLLVPLVGVLVYAWLHGRRVGRAADASAAPPTDATD